MIDRERWRGEIAYLGAGGEATGRELFSVSVHADGSVTLRAQCEMDDDALVRDAILSLDAEGLPAEAFVRTVEQGRHIGSRWYRFDAAPRPRFFGTHSLVNDGWLARLGAAMRAGERRRLDGLITCSLQANGGGAPALHETSAILAYVGEERVTRPAGDFNCRHWRVGYGDYPPLDMWVTGPLDLLVAMEWRHLSARYELASLRRVR